MVVAVVVAVIDSDMTAGHDPEAGGVSGVPGTVSVTQPQPRAAVFS